MPGEFSSDSETDERQSLADRARVKMAERAASSSGVISEFQKVVVAKGKQVIMSPEGIWADSKSYFITKGPLVDEKKFYRSLEALYKSKHPNGPLAPYYRGDFDR